MYRYYASKRRRYRCDNLECHKTVHADNTDTELHNQMASCKAPWYIHRTEELNAERDRRIANLDEALDNLNKTARLHGWTLQRKRDVEDAMLAERDKLTAIPDREPVLLVDVMHDGDRALTEGDQWLTMTMGERRDLLTGGSVTVYVRSNGDHGGSVIVDVERDS